MGGKFGIKDTKEVLDLGFGCLDVWKAANADDKIDLNDLGHLLILVPKVKPAIDDIKLVLKELGELDAGDSSELLTWAAGRIGATVGDPIVVNKVVATLNFVLAAVGAYGAWTAKAPEAPAEA